MTVFYLSIFNEGKISTKYPELGGGLLQIGLDPVAHVVHVNEALLGELVLKETVFFAKYDQKICSE